MMEAAPAAPAVPAAPAAPASPAAAQSTQEVLAAEEGVPLTAPPAPVECNQVMVGRARREDWLGHGVEINLDDVEFDLDATKGQIREITPDVLQRLRNQFDMAEPLAPLHAVLVACDAAGVPGLLVA